MQRVEVAIAPIACTLSELTAFTPDTGQVETIFAQDEPFGVRLTVTFEGGGAIALMPLALPITVDFYAKPYGMGDGITLGTVTLPTVARQLTYQPALLFPTGSAILNIDVEKIYNVSALFKVGTATHPALIYGFIENLAIQIYNP